MEEKFWTLRECINQCAHLLGGLWITILVYYLFSHSYYIIFTGLITGLIVEIIEYFYMDNKELVIKDRIRDILFWVIGSYSLFIVKFLLK